MVPAQSEGEVMKYLHTLREEVIHTSNLRSLPNGTDKTDKRRVEGTSVSFGSAESEDIQISTVDNFTGSLTNPKIYTPTLSELPKLTEAEDVDLTALLTEACQDVEGIDAATFRALLSPVDVEDIEGGSIPMVTLNAYARSFVEGIRCGRITVLAAASGPSSGTPSVTAPGSGAARSAAKGRDRDTRRCGRA